MTKFTEQFHTNAKDVRLTDAERSRSRAALMSAMRPAAVPSPFFTHLFFSRVAVAFIAVVVIGGGTAFAAEGTIPGDLLYPVKVSITEPITGALAITDEAKAKWHASVAETRLDEAEQLAAKGELTATTSSELAANFTEHADAVAALTNDGDADQSNASADISSSFSSAVATHGAAILAAGKKSKSLVAIRASGDLVVNVASGESDDDADTDNVTAPVAMHPVMMAKMMTPMTLSLPTAPSQEDPSSLSASAHAEFGDATTTLADANLSEDDTNDANADAASIANKIVKADAELDLGSTTDAITDFHEALADIAKLRVFISAHEASDIDSDSDTDASDDASIDSDIDSGADE